MTKTLKEEIHRKIFHFIAILPVCFIVYNLSNKYFYAIVPFVLLVFVFDFFALYSFFEKSEIFFVKKFFYLLRSDEKERYTLNGSTWILIAIFVCFLLNFKKEAQITGFLILAISDSLAAVFGKKYGTVRIMNKTPEGSLAFFLSAFAITLSSFLLTYNYINFIWKIIILKSLFISSFLTILELFAQKIKLNDNFLIPVSFCLIYKLFNYLIL